MIKISTSILSSQNRQHSVNELNKTTTDYIHIDTMDGNFVPNYQLPTNEIIELHKYTEKPFDVHLMVEDPEQYIKELANLNISFITIHLEIKKDINHLIKLIKSFGYKVGISIKPNTPAIELTPYIEDIDMVLIMSVEPGQGGQEFIPSSIDKAKTLKELNPNLIIEMDGGIKAHNINNIKNYVDIAVVGSYITNSNNYQEAINNLKQ